MAALDLKPLLQETIDQMGFDNHNLWLVKIDETVYGPFETESLKHYASENETQFETALATRMDLEDFKPFWSQAILQRRSPQALKNDHAQGPFWLLENGLKIGPFSFQDIDKKIDSNLLGLTDHVSIDDGHNWKKIFEVQGFDRRVHTAEELPSSPQEDSFHKANLALVEKMDNQHANPAEELASLAHIGQQAKVIQFNSEDVAFHAEKTVEVSDSLKWAIPTAAAAVIAFLSTGYFMFSSGEETPEAPLVTEVETKKKEYQRPVAAPEPKGFVPQVQRMPASTSYSQPPREVYQPQQESRYPTHLEVHESQHYEERVVERDPADGPVMENDQQQQPQQEHSLVGTNNNNRRSRNPADDQNNVVDDAMNDNQQNQQNQGQDQQPIDEVTDF